MLYLVVQHSIHLSNSAGLRVGVHSYRGRAGAAVRHVLLLQEVLQEEEEEKREEGAEGGHQPELGEEHGQQLQGESLLNKLK